MLECSRANNMSLIGLLVTAQYREHAKDPS